MNATGSSIGIVIVTHNSAGFIEPCLEAALQRSSQVVVVDNASSDQTCQIVRRFSHVRLLANAHNAGFAAAVNQGFARLSCEFVLVLNPDAILQSGLEILAEACRLPKVAAAAGQLIDTAGRPQTGFMVRRFPTATVLALETLGLNKLWPGNPVNRRYRCLDLDYSKPQDVDQPAGAFLMIARRVWLELGGFDEQFHPLWFEDVDFLERLRKQGYRTRFVPEAAALHYGAHSIAGMQPRLRVWYWYANLLRYAAKHFRSKGFRTVAAAVAVGTAARMITGISAGHGLKPLAEYGKVLRLAGKAVFVGPSCLRGEACGSSLNLEKNSDSTLRNSHSHGS
ncbi:MAG: glycosyltransferase family 2 protein [Acidobacteriia bacterium]|nr:glycosyltransferase family 2 protein [Terriglobia bacterium]